MSVIGLDPGGKGAYVAIMSSREFHSVRWSTHAPSVVLHWLYAANMTSRRTAYVEKLGFRTGDGQKSGIDKMIHTAGKQEILLELAGFEIEYVRPDEWQKEFGVAGLSHLTNQQKQAHYIAKVLELYGVKVTQEEGSGVLIATYGYRKEHGELTNGRTTKGGSLRVSEREAPGILWGSRSQAKGLF